LPQVGVGRNFRDFNAREGKVGREKKEDLRRLSFERKNARVTSKNVWNMEFLKNREGSGKPKKVSKQRKIREGGKDIRPKKKKVSTSSNGSEL